MADNNNTDNTISFYRSTDSYGCFSNFSYYKFYYKGYLFKNSETAFQAMKYEGTPYFLEILKARTASDSARLGRLDNPIHKKRDDWSQVKDQIMFEICFEKFNQNDDLKFILMDTGNSKIIENSANDYYWGVGSDGTGRNQLGKTIMRIRRIFKDELKKVKENQ